VINAEGGAIRYYWNEGVLKLAWIDLHMQRLMYSARAIKTPFFEKIFPMKGVV
jgi:branched-subunit amino acid aminotransferase/4-amino-4-deoxychorismate lyase